MVNTIIRSDDKVYLVKRILNENTSQESATLIHHNLGTDSLLRDKSGKWFCCLLSKDVEYRDIELIRTEPIQDYSHTQFELGDNGGLG
jgi:hypothetical protein